MIDVATLSVIRRWALREHLSIREIARRTGLSRNTIRKYLRSDVVQPRLAQRTIVTKLDPFACKSRNICLIVRRCLRERLASVRNQPDSLQANGSSYQKEAPRLCRGGSRSLTFQEVVHRRDFQS